MKKSLRAEDEKTEKLQQVLKDEETAEQIQNRNDVKTVLGTKSGKRFVWRLLEYCETYRTVINPNPYLMAHNAGRQDVGHYLMMMVNDADPYLLPNAMIAKLKETRKKKEEENGT